MTPITLKNRYYALRHGQSRANVNNLVVSDPMNGVNDYGLSDTGRGQTKEALAVQSDLLGLDQETLIYASDFLRTRETARIAAVQLGSARNISFTPLLRERFFGRYEMGPADCYERVWANDAKNICPKETGVEPVEAVLKRGLACLEKIEALYRGKTILLVSHGDTLQILMTFFTERPPSRHRELPHLETAEIRKLSQN